MKKQLCTIALVIASTASHLYGQTGESSYKVPDGLIHGGAFIDRFLPVPVIDGLESDVWGADSVIPRDADNGIEDAEFSHWGGKIITGEDGKEHLFVCRWPENERRGKREGHRLWSSSSVVHAVSDHPLGPYKVIEEIGKGHNPEIYRRKDGTFVIGVMGEKAYKAKTLVGPWTQIPTGFIFKDQDLNKTNRTYVPREDGSLLMMNKNGYVFISEDGEEQFTQVTEKSVFPKIKNHFEDPVIWKDEVQYHLIVNDWYTRKAFHMRSADGIEWKWDPGYAYDTSIMTHDEGTTENWFKFERPKVRQDQFGRATHMNFAAIDVVKKDDLAGDTHSSKNVVIPLVVPRRLELLSEGPLSAKTYKIRVKILAEEGFNPQTDVDVKSLMFGAPEQVDFGNGCKVIDSEASGSDLIVTFSGKGNGITKDNFAAKLIGKNSKGALLFGYANLPATVASKQ
ncbi:hypothetical protein CKO51_24560 [Rhodopirellula sp. SM50]|nr:glycoside hydrolase family protein [Rhodopirellula sp. SM50]PAY16812.1 hypothetical protein CKO51_24560 [Rhodopirellula sp. SM50]